MVEAMFERSPSYFKQFQKQFKFLVTNEKINWSSVKNFAVCSHFDSEFCQLTTTTSTNHFHVLIDTSEAATTYNDIFKRNKAFPVSCLFTTFRYLFSSAVDMETKGDVFFKLKLRLISTLRTKKNLSLQQQCGSVYQQLLLYHNSYKRKLLQTQTKIMEIL